MFYYKNVIIWFSMLNRIDAIFKNSMFSMFFLLKKKIFSFVVWS